ncbi:dUTP diphosphatase [Lentibacillus sp. L22]|uniref:dUTP diphosphatase n=1 Tax=Lentibacillus TaxID=175304 RepID=UPI0022B19E28|nr:dUTP diphosphatase [Lentibacillus daqui]
MDWNRLFVMQEKLDQYIENNQGITGKDLFSEKVLALLVEIGELANETRCFKFWSKKPKSDKEIILAEYVDGLHFMMSLGLDSGYQYETQPIEPVMNTETEQFNLVFEACVLFNQDPSLANYHHMFVTYLQLGKKLGFDEEDIYDAYIEKNGINYERQDHGY